MEFIISFLPFIVLFGVMYFMLIRPQKKQQEKKQEMLSQMKQGDHVITIGGLHGIIDEVNEADSTIVIDCEGVYLTFDKAAIGRVTSSDTAEARVEAAAIANEVTQEEIEEGSPIDNDDNLTE